MGRLGRFAGCFAVASLVAGCGVAHNMQVQKEADEAKRVRELEGAERKRLYPSPTERPVVPRLKCLAAADPKYHMAFDRSVGNSNLDLVRVLNARLQVIGERYDKGGVTEVQFELEKAEAVSAFRTAVVQRTNSATIAAAAAQQADAATAEAISSSMPRTCTKSLNSVTCY